MKHTLFTKLLLALVVFLGFQSCDDRELIKIDNVAAPILAQLSADEIFLDQNFPDNSALIITWQNAQYSVPTEIRYQIEASADEAFTNPVLVSAVNGSETFTSLTVNELNNLTEKLGFEPDIQQQMFIRVRGFIGNQESLPTISNVTSVKVTPYIVIITYPDFYLVGAAAYMGWDAGNAQLLYQNEFSNYLYTYLSGGESFRFLGQQDWGPVNYSTDLAGTRDEYHFFKTLSANIIQAPGDDENMTFTGDSGVYKIVIDASDGVHSLKATASAIPGFDFPHLYLVGTLEGNGWAPESSIEMDNNGPGLFSYVATLSEGEQFKFIGQQSWGDLEWGNILPDNDGNSGFIGPKGDNSNILFDGDGGQYKISVNLKAGIYTIVKQ